MGTVLVPGGNDSLILFGLPRLWPNAWLAGVRQPVRGADPYRARCASAPSGHGYRRSGWSRHWPPSS